MAWLTLHQIFHTAISCRRNWGIALRLGLVLGRICDGRGLRMTHLIKKKKKGARDVMHPSEPKPGQEYSQE